MGYAGQVSLGHAGFYGLGAYVSAVLSVRYGLTPWLGMPIAALATGALAYVVGIPTLRLKSYYLGMATLGIGAVLHLAFVQLHRITGGSSGLAGILPWDLGPLRFTTATEHYVLVWAFAAVGSLGRAQSRQRARRPRAARARRERGRGGGDGRRHRGGEAPRLRAVRGVRLGGGQPLRALHHGDQPGDLLVPVLGRPRPDGGDRRHRAVLGRGGGRGAADRPARGPAPLRRLGGAALRPGPHRRDPVPAARHRRALRARGAGRSHPPARPSAGRAPPSVPASAPSRRPSLRRSRAHGPRCSRSAASPSSSAACAPCTTAPSASPRARSRR